MSEVVHQQEGQNLPIPIEEWAGHAEAGGILKRDGGVKNGTERNRGGEAEKGGGLSSSGTCQICSGSSLPSPFLFGLEPAKLLPQVQRDPIAEWES